MRCLQRIDQAVIMSVNPDATDGICQFRTVENDRILFNFRQFSCEINALIPANWILLLGLRLSGTREYAIIANLCP
jgi:hypothetical protein